MIKIISGWSNPGGSTTSWINLTNELNKQGYETMFFGPHTWAQDKCNFNPIGASKINPEDSIIIHFSNIESKPKCKKIIFSSHEQDLFLIAEKVSYSFFDKLHFVSLHQRKYHNLNWPYIIIPNIVEDLKVSPMLKSKIGLVIGSIDRNKNTHISIQRALADGMAQVLIYGKVSSSYYYQMFVLPLIKQYSGIVVMMDYQEDKQKMYDSGSDIYLYSLNEAWSYIKPEAQKTGTNFHTTNSVHEDVEVWDTNKIINTWIKELGV